MKRIFASTLIVLAASFTSNAQITVTNTQTPADLINNVLLGSGVTATNITVNGSAALANTVQPSATYFNQNGTVFPITDGILLSSGAGQVAVGPNTATGESNSAGTLTVTDPDMSAIAAAGITNGIVIEFDFIATGNMLEFNYIFGSEEYPEFAPPNSSGFNDVFGFFLSGTGLNGPYTNNAVNIATVPGTTTPVSINNVNAITNQAYYVDNTGGLFYGSAIEYDGTTTTLTAFSELVCGELYHIKLGISNVADQGWDSGVFLEGGSFTTNPVQFTFNSYSPNNTISEGCSQLAELMFTREGCNNQNDSLIAYINYGGTATNGVDFNQLDDSVLLEPGVDTVIWTIDPFEDGIPEGIESIELEIITITLLGDTLYSYATFYISDVPPFDVTANDVNLYCLGDSADIFAIPSGGFAPFTYSWSNGEPDSSFVFTPTSNGTTDIYVTVTDFCGYTTTDTSTIVMNQTLAIDTIITQDAGACLPNGWASAQVVGVTSQQGQPYYHWTGPGNPGPYNVDGTAITDIPSGWYYFTVEDDVCSAEDSVFINMNNPPIASFTASPTTGCGPLAVTITNNSQNTTTYAWDFGNGNSTTVTTLDPINQTYVTSGTIMLIASDNSGCADTAYADINVSPCGCTDPEAENYNPLALIDDGSCTYPTPIIVAPNVFTPNDDNVNDLFVLDAINTTRIVLVITNRWGNVMYSGSGVNPAWDGTDVEGNKAADGVYFYKYEAYGTDDEMISGHGFVHLERK